MQYQVYLTFKTITKMNYNLVHVLQIKYINEMNIEAKLGL